MELVKKNNREYKIIPENNVVICRTQKYSLTKEWETEKKKVKEILKTAAFQNDISAEEYYISKAFCDGRDEFDEKKGIDIASEKADLQRHVAAMKYYVRMITSLSDAVDACDKLFRKHSDKAQVIYDDMVKTYGWTE